MAGRTQQVEHELLSLAFRGYPRALLSSLGFGVLTFLFVWPALNQRFLVVWLVGFLAISLLRLELSQVFFKTPGPVSDPTRWARLMAYSTGLQGLWWGILAAAALALTPGETVYAVWTVFLIILFAVLGSQTTASHPWVFRAYVMLGMAPVIVASMVLPSPHYAARLAGEALLFFAAWTAGRSGNNYVEQSIAMRFENTDLLRDLEQQRQELDRANAAKTRFLAAASHDLRQPMQALVLLVETLRERVKDPVNQRITGSIHATVESMSSLLNEILDISRLDAGTVAPHRTSFRLSTVFDRLRASYAYPAARKDLLLRVRSTDHIVKTDPVLLYRILANLVDNALRYTRKGGVLVGCRPRAEGVWVEVWDTGVGIPEDQHDTIFLEFHQLANQHRDREQGFGLGLAIVDRTARLLQLPLKLRSAPGHGSVFRLRVPYGDPAQARGPEVDRAPEPLENCRVVVVEDDVEIRSAMLLLLEGWRCDVSAVASGAELDALLATMDAPPDALIADYRLPGEENGIHIVQRVRARWPKTLGILISGDVTPTVLRAAKDAGIELVHKPIRPARLRALLGSMRARNRALALDEE
jgi:signal transduction histidine kinase